MDRHVCNNKYSDTNQYCLGDICTLAVTCSAEDEADAETWWEDHECAAAADIEGAANIAEKQQLVEVNFYQLHHVIHLCIIHESSWVVLHVHTCLPT